MFRIDRYSVNIGFTVKVVAFVFCYCIPYILVYISWKFRSENMFAVKEAFSIYCVIKSHGKTFLPNSYRYVNNR